MEPLIGIDPSHTTEFAFKGATFVLGVLPASEWEFLHHRFLDVYRNAQRRSIAQAVSGEDEKAIYVRMGSDPEFRRESLKVYDAVARQAIRSHSGFLKRDRTPVPQTDERFAWYAMVPGLLEEAFRHVRSMHVLEDNAKKE